MDRFLCQLCYTIVRCGEYHPCFFYKECNSIPNPNESEEKVTMNAMLEEVHTENLNDNFVTIYSNFQENIFEETSEETTENNEQISLLPSSTRTIKYPSLLAVTSNNTWSLSSSDNSLPDSTTVIRQCTVNTTKNNSTCKSLCGSKNNFESPTTIANTAFPMDQKKLHEFEAQKNPLDTSIANLADTGSLGSNINAKLNFKKPQKFRKDASPVAGLPVIRPRLQTTAEKRKHDSDLCPPKLKNEPGLVSHDGKCEEEKRFECNICERRFGRKSHLDTHFRTHTGERPYGCDYCDWRFNQKSNLNNHVRIHTGEKPFKCEICEKGFAQQSSLRQHAETHTQEKPFKCDACGKGFKSDRARIKHRKENH